MRLIDADALKETIASNVYPVADYLNSRDYGMFWTGGIEKAIDEQPTVMAWVLGELASNLHQSIKFDAIQVIRCKDCKWYDMTDSSGTVEPIGYRCKKVNRLWREPDDFCKGAERKEE